MEHNGIQTPLWLNEYVENNTILCFVCVVLVIEMCMKQHFMKLSCCFFPQDIQFPWEKWGDYWPHVMKYVM